MSSTSDDEPQLTGQNAGPPPPRPKAALLAGLLAIATAVVLVLRMVATSSVGIRAAFEVYFGPIEPLRLPFFLRQAYPIEVVLLIACGVLILLRKKIGRTVFVAWHVLIILPAFPEIVSDTPAIGPKFIAAIVTTTVLLYLPRTSAWLSRQSTKD